jgi:hypothetical protein
MLNIQRFLDSRLRDECDVSLTRMPRFTKQKVTGTHFCYRLSTQGYDAAGRIKHIQTVL